MASALKEAIKTIGDTIVDLTELKVQTVTGDVTAVLNTKKLDDLEALLTPDGQGDTAKARLNLMLETTIKFDGDSLNFINEGEVTPQLLELHKGAVSAGLTQRQGLLEMFKGLIK